MVDGKKKKKALILYIHSIFQQFQQKQVIVFTSYTQIYFQRVIKNLTKLVFTHGNGKREIMKAKNAFKYRCLKFKLVLLNIPYIIDLVHAPNFMDLKEQAGTFRFC